MSEELFKDIEKYIKKIDTPERREVYRDAELRPSATARGRNHFYRWECYWEWFRQASGETLIRFESEELGTDAIDEALQKIVKPL